MKRLFLAIGLLASLPACTAEPAPEAPAAAACTIDPDARLRWADWSPDMDAKGGTTFTYTGCGKQLVFVAARHGNISDSPTFNAVRDAIADGPDLVLLEGVPAARGDSYGKLLDYAEGVAGKPTDNEAMLTARTAHAAGIPFRGAEPLDTDVIMETRAAGLSDRDLLGFYMLRQLPQMQRGGAYDDLSDPRMEGVVADIAPYFADELGLAATEAEALDTMPEFAAWYADFNGEDFVSGFEPPDTYPSTAVEDPRASNFASDTVADARDAFILAQVRDALAAHDHVLIVYGGSHHSVLRPALEAAFGAATASP